jgi:class 3 adenylate cyclase
MDRPRKNLRTPDETIAFPGIVEDLVEIAGFTISRTVQDPGWRWSTDMQPLVGGEWCEANHVGVMISGRVGALLRDGTVLEFGADDVYDIPPGHDGYTIGDEPAVMIEWSGMRTFASSRAGLASRVLATLLFTDLVDSTSTAAGLGDAAWRELLSVHYQSTRAELERFGGREVSTTGDGVLAMFDAPVRAVLCAAAVRTAAGRHGVRVRVGVHVGEVEQVGDDLRGIAVHEAVRIMAEAGPDEILVSEITSVLAGSSGLAFEDRGSRTLKGLPEPLRLFAYTG